MRMEDKNQKLQKKIKKALADALQAGSVSMKELYAALFMFSVCRDYEEQVEVLGFFAGQSPDLNKLFVQAKATTVAI